MWDLYCMIHLVHMSVHVHQVCILHSLALVPKPVTVRRQVLVVYSLTCRVKPCFWMPGAAQLSQCHVME